MANSYSLPHGTLHQSQRRVFRNQERIELGHTTHAHTHGLGISEIPGGRSSCTGSTKQLLGDGVLPSNSVEWSCQTSISTEVESTAWNTACCNGRDARCLLQIYPGYRAERR